MHILSHSVFVHVPTGSTTPMQLYTFQADLIRWDGPLISGVQDDQLLAPSILLDFWVKVTPGILQLVSHSKVSARFRRMTSDESGKYYSCKLQGNTFCLGVLCGICGDSRCLLVEQCLYSDVSIVFFFNRFSWQCCCLGATFNHLQYPKYVTKICAKNQKCQDGREWIKHSSFLGQITIGSLFWHRTIRFF